jgi:cell division protease FtsH
VYGMSEKAPNLSLVGQRGAVYLGGGVDRAPHSEGLAETLDTEALAILEHCYEQAKAAIVGERDRLEALAKRLLEDEELDRATLLSLLGERPARAPWNLGHESS